jgi:NADP-dependent 3-hydroxy acid dehydrogenase YdfG
MMQTDSSNAPQHSPASDPVREVRMSADATHKRVAWVLGAGSGIGHSAALLLAREGWAIVASGRREAELQGVAAEIERSGGTAAVEVCDVVNADAVSQAHARIASSQGGPDLVVHCAGVNTPKRHWDVLEAADARRVIDINLGGVMNVMATVVPAMRKRQGGTVVVVSSWAGWRFTAFTGPSYSASKAALAPLVESINQQAGGDGVRATLVCPAEVATPILAQRPNPPSTLDMARMLRPQDVAEAIAYAARQPAGVCINELVISPTWNRIYREPEALR